MTHFVRALLLAILLAHFGLALQYSLRTPLGESPDEADHWAYTVYLATERRLPVGPELTQAKHPPLYFIGAALMASFGDPAIDFFRPNPAVNLTPGPAYSPNFFQHEELLTPPWTGAALTFHLARLWSVLLSTATVAAAAALALATVPSNPAVAVATAGLAAFVPQFLFVGGSVNNDNGAALLGALALWGAMVIYQKGGPLRSCGWTGIALGLGVLTKVSALALWPVAGLALLLGLLPYRSGQTWRDFGRALIFKGAMLMVPATLVVAPLLARNQRLYGDPFGMSMALQTIDQRTEAWTRVDTLWLLRGWFLSFWGKFGGAGHIPMAGWTYWLFGVLCLLGVAGLIAHVWLRRRQPWQVAVPLLLLAIAPVLVGLVMWRYSLVALGTDQGRLLFPAYAAIVTLLATGLVAPLPRQKQLAAALAITCLTAGLAIYALWSVIVPTFVGT